MTLLAIVGVLALMPEAMRLLGLGVAAVFETYYDARAWWDRHASAPRVD